MLKLIAKYIAFLVSILLLLGTLPSIYFIAEGLIVGTVVNPNYFIFKLIIYLAVVVILTFVSIKLFKSLK